MAHQRNASTVDAVKEPHSVSLKVLRLSKPSLSVQHPLPYTPSSSPLAKISPSPSSSLAYPTTAPNDTSPFILSPVLTLPPAFGSAYVGETFSCTLCANNEILPSSYTGVQRTISNVRIEAEMKTPSSEAPIPLALLSAEDPASSPPESSADEDEDEDEEEEEESEDEEKSIVEKKKKEKDAAATQKGVDLAPGHSLQKIVNFDLKEEGSHVLAVTIVYSETTPTSGRVRTFRKLYQFVCKSCMVVRTKSGLLPSANEKPDESTDTDATSEGGKEERKSSSSRRGGRKWALEAQLENTGDEILTLDIVVLETREGFRSQGINWEVFGEGEEMERPVLQPGDVQQVCFIVEEVGIDGEEMPPDANGRLVFGVLSIGWRGPMGDRGFLTTGLLGARIK
ncbi:hypothetical protein F5884DRAFT_79219 [Xylogone sp. PMI_703]|nr:hypothetical protein F5884DRAFT_79219 [Xylogone sp. PMI_703]